MLGIKSDKKNILILMMNEKQMHLQLTMYNIKNPNLLHLLSNKQVKVFV